MIQGIESYKFFIIIITPIQYEIELSLNITPLFHINGRIRIPDSTPYDFLLWEIIKDRVYAAKYHVVGYIKFLIEEKFTLLNNNMELCQSICLSIPNRCQMYIITEGKQFKHLL